MRADPWFDVAVRFRAPSGEVHTLSDGDLIGRLWSTTLSILDPRISECHAVVERLGCAPILTSLRGRFRVDGVVAHEIHLRAGQCIELAPGVALAVVSVRRASHQLHLRIDEGPPLPITSPTTLRGSPPVPVPTSPFSKRDQTTLWRSERTWLRSTHHGPTPFADGESWTTHGYRVQAVWLPVDPTARSQAPRPGGHHFVDHQGRLTLRTVTGTARFRGRQASLLRTLITTRQPVHWKSLAADLWGTPPEHVRRASWDMLLARIRTRIRAVGGRHDLLRSDGHGLVEVTLRPEDTVDHHANDK